MGMTLSWLAKLALYYTLYTVEPY